MTLHVVYLTGRSISSFAWHPGSHHQEDWDTIDKTVGCDIRDQGVPAGCIHKLHAFCNGMRDNYSVNSANVNFKVELLMELTVRPKICMEKLRRWSTSDLMYIDNDDPFSTHKQTKKRKTKKQKHSNKKRSSGLSWINVQLMQVPSNI